MEQIQVSDKAAAQIKSLRDSAIGSMEGEYEKILDSLSGLNNIILCGQGFRGSGLLCQ